MSSAIRLISKVICLVLVLSFGMFVVDEMSTASAGQTALATNSAELATVVTRDAHGREVHSEPTRIRTQLDQANDALTQPAEKLVTSSSGTTSPWIQRGVPFILGLLFFGLALHMLANWLEMSRSGGASADPNAGFTAGYR
jgi:hypothetical protein